MTNRLVCRRCQTPYNQESRPPRTEGRCDICGETLVHREDDHPALIKARLRTFHRSAQPVIEYYHQRGKLVVINAEQAFAAVHQAIADTVKAVEEGAPLPAASDSTVRTLLQRVEAPSARITPALHSGLDIVLLGAPGSGKGTQAQMICAELDLPHIATGDLFRDNLKRKTELGQLARTYMDRGELVPDEVTDAMVKDRLRRDDTATGYVLDGYPRNLHQAQALNDMEEALDRNVRGALYIHVGDEEIVSRLSGRWICRDCQTPFHLRFKPPAKAGICDACGGELYQRDDDNPETVRARLKIFHAKTEPVIEFYRKAGVLTEVDGEGDVPAITARCLDVVRGLRAAARST
jgi:adenylate kinase